MVNEGYKYTLGKVKAWEKISAESTAGVKGKWRHKTELGEASDLWASTDLFNIQQESISQYNLHGTSLIQR